MARYSLLFLYVLVGILLLANCVREIDFQNDEAGQSTLVVNGTFTDQPGPHILRLSHPSNYNKQAFEPVTGAQATLSDDLGHSFPYQEISLPNLNTYYQLEGIQGEPGRSYTLEIKLANGNTYRSQPQRMLEPLPLDAVELKAQWYTTTSAIGSVVREPFVYAYARSRAPEERKDRYLHWEGEVVYIFNEIMKIYDPFGVQHQCFITNRISDQNIAIADLNDYQPGGIIYENAGKRRLDNAFESKICFIVQQRTINREAYDYWSRINQLISATGTIFDSPPAAVFGNVENVNKPKEPALGYFEVSSTVLRRIYIADGAFGEEFNSGLQYCQYDWSTWPPVNHNECHNCLTLPNSTLQKPDWWQ